MDWLANNLAIWKFLIHGHEEMAERRVPACFPVLPNGKVREHDPLVPIACSTSSTWLLAHLTCNQKRCSPIPAYCEYTPHSALGLKLVAFGLRAGI